MTTGTHVIASNLCWSKIERSKDAVKGPVFVVQQWIVDSTAQRRRSKEAGYALVDAVTRGRNWIHGGRVNDDELFAHSVK